MIKAKILLAERLTHMPDQERGSHPVIKIVTDLPKGQNNSFYIDPTDLKKNIIRSSFDHASNDKPLDPTEINPGDDITFDIQDGIHKAVSWNDRKIRQREYSFDDYATQIDK